MERKIRVVDSASQDTYTINADVNTLAELKQAIMSATGSASSYFNGKTFMVAVAKVELKTDDSLLPSSIPTADGGTTNDLTVLITSAQKKIASGMDRKEAYKIMKENPELAQSFKKKNKNINYTNASTDDLVRFIKKNHTSNAGVQEKEPVPSVETKKEVPAAQAENSECNCGDQKCKKLASLIEEMYSKGSIQQKDYENLMGVLDGEEPEPVEGGVSPTEISHLFGGWAK